MSEYGARRFVKWLRRSEPEVVADVETELMFHIEMRAAALRRAGMSAADALAQARAELGDGAELASWLRRSELRIESKTMWRTRVDELRQDIRFTLRSIGMRRGFAATVVGTLALGIGVATAVFCVIDAVLLRPLPVSDQDRVMVAWTTDPVRDFDHIPFTFIAYEQLRAAMPSAAATAAIPYWFASRMAAGTADAAVPLHVAPVSGEFFDVLGVVPLAGRLLGTEDDQTGSPAVVVLAHAAAERLFGSATGSLEQALPIDGRIHHVVGVTPPGFAYPRGAEAWTALVPLYAAAPGGLETLRGRGYYAFDILIRAAPGSSVEEVRAELRHGIDAAAADGLMFTAGELRAPLLSDVVVGDVRPALLMLGAAVLLVLVIAGLNVANLLLVRGVTRHRELAVRAALGAGRSRIIRQLGTEALVLTLLAAAVGLLLAHVALKVMLALAPAELPRMEGIAIDPRAAVFATLCAALAALAFGVLPAVRTSQVSHERLRMREDGGAAGRGAHIVRHALVGAQIAIACMVLSTAGLLIRSLERMQALDFGFDPAPLVIVELSFPNARFATDSAHQQAMISLAQRAASLPGVTTVTAVLTRPFAGNTGFDMMVYGERMSESIAAEPPIVNYEGVDAAYFETIGLPILSGRAILESDRAGSERVVVVNQAMAELYWPGQDAVGRRLKGGDADSPDAWRTVVGIAGDARYRELTDVRPSIYVPFGQGIPVRPNYLLLRTALGAAGIAGPLRELVRSTESTASVLELAGLPVLLRTPLARPRFQSVLTAGFALIGLALSALGAYAVLAFFVQQRRRDIGIRMALGATAGAVRGMILRQALLIASVGIAFGIIGTLIAGRLMQALLFASPAVDPGVLGTTVLVLLAASIAAALLPLRAAAATDPMLIIRAD